MSERLRALIVEDSEDDATLLVRELKRGGYDPEFKRVDTPKEFFTELENGGWDIIISDYNMPGFSGLDALEILKKSGADLPFILVSGAIGEDVAVEALLAGAHDYLVKGDWGRLIPAIKRELQEAEVRKERKRAEEALKEEKEKAQIYLNVVGVMLCALNPSGEIILINQRGCEILNVTEDQAIGKNWFDNYIPKRLVDEVKELFNTLIRGEIESAEYYENSVLTSDGKERILAFHNTVLTGENENISAILFSGEDITERKRAEEALRESEEKFRSVTQSANDAIISADKEGKIVSWNNGAWRMFGYEEEEVLGEPLAMLIPEKHRRTHKNRLDRFVSTGEAKFVGQSVELEGLRKDGSEFPLDISLSSWKIGKEIYFSAIIRDITERKRTEEKIRESEERFRRAITDAPIPIMIHAEDGEVLQISDIWTALTGYTHSDIPTIGDWTLNAFGQRMGDVRSTIEAVFERNAVAHDGEFTVKTKSGESRVWDFSSSPTGHLPDGRRLVISMAMDITERKKAEQELVNLYTAIENTAETILVTDKEGIIRYCNLGFEQASGYTREEAIGKNPRFLKSGEHDAAFYKELWDTITNGDVWHGRMINKKKSGELYEEESTLSPIKDQTGAITGYVSAKRDVTREVMLEKQLRQAQKMESIGTLAGGIAHDLNNILMPIIGYSTMAKEMTDKDSEVKEFLDEIIVAGNRAKKLVKQILTFSRRDEQVFQPLEIHLIAKEVLQLLKSTIPATVEIDTDIDIQSGSIMGDPTQIHQVIVNLCTNAAYAMKDSGGVMTVTLKRKKLGNGGANETGGGDFRDYVKLSVSDTGCGMEPAILEKIFEPFFTTKPEGEGTGLGLSVIYGIVKSHCGHIDVESQPGEGTKFHVLLPLIAQSPGGGNVEEGKEYKKVKGKALVVDDQIDVVKTVEKMLNYLDYETTIMTDSEEALKLFRKNPGAYDFVITDMTMPKMTGDKLAKEMLKLRGDIPIILMTGYSDAINKQRAREIGIREMMSKPVTPHDLSRVISHELADK